MCRFSQVWPNLLKDVKEETQHTGGYSKLGDFQKVVNLRVLWLGGFVALGWQPTGDHETQWDNLRLKPSKYLELSV